MSREPEHLRKSQSYIATVSFDAIARVRQSVPGLPEYIAGANKTEPPPSPGQVVPDAFIERVVRFYQHDAKMQEAVVLDPAGLRDNIAFRASFGPLADDAKLLEQELRGFLFASRAQDAKLVRDAFDWLVYKAKTTSSPRYKKVVKELRELRREKPSKPKAEKAPKKRKQPDAVTVPAESTTTTTTTSTTKTEKT